MLILTKSPSRQCPYPPQQTQNLKHQIFRPLNTPSQGWGYASNEKSKEEALKRVEKAYEEWIINKKDRRKLSLKYKTDCVKLTKYIKEKGHIFETFDKNIFDNIDNEKVLPQFDQILIEELQLPIRAYNCLKRAGINSIGQLLKYSQEEIKEIKNFGKKSADQLFETLKNKFNILLSSSKS